MEDCELIAFLRQAIADIELTKAYSIELLKEAEKMRHLMDEIGRPLIGATQSEHDKE